MLLIAVGKKWDSLYVDRKNLWGLGEGSDEEKDAGGGE